MIFDGICTCGPDEIDDDVVACACGKECEVEIDSMDTIHVDGEHWKRECYEKGQSKTEGSG